MPSKSRFDIFGKISMTDKVTGSLKKAGKSVTGFSRKMQNQFRMADLSAKSLNKRMNKIGGKSARVGMMGLGAAVGFAAAEYISFDDSIIAATARFKDVDVTSKNATKTLAKLGATAQKVGGSTKFTATQAAQGLDFLARAGFTSVEAMGSVASMVKLVTVTGEDFIQTFNRSSDLLGSLGLDSDNAATKIKNLKEMNAVLGLATNKANVTLEDMFETLKIAGPLATGMGLSYKELTAATALLASSGVKGTRAATGMANVFGRITEVTPKVTNGLAALGLSQKDFIAKSGDMIPIEKIFIKLSKATTGMGKVKKSQLFTQIFGKQGRVAATLLTRDFAKLDGIMKDIGGTNAQKKFDAINKFMGKSLLVKIKGVSSAFQFMTAKVFKEFSSKGGDMFGSLANGLRKFNVSPIVDTLKVMLIIVSTLLTVLSPFLPAIVAIVAGIKIWAIAQTALNLIMTANPIGLLIVGIGLLVSAIVFMSKSTNTAFLPMQLQLQEYIFKWNTLWFNIMRVGNALGVVSSKTLSSAAADQQLSFIKGKMLALKLNQSQSSQNLASPNSRGINSTTTNNTHGTLKLDVNTPAGSSVDTSTSGNINPFVLDTGRG